jgi:phospholipid/cholesterol/gamma-HCH transport system ATP-binding protein
MIQFVDVTFSRGERVILNSLHFSINTSERVAILGGSGEGKTTILRLIMRLLLPDNGKVIIDGVDITMLSESALTSVRKKFSIVFQDGALFDSLTVKENVAFCIREYSNETEEAIDRKVRDLLSIVGVEEAIDLMPEELSGGMLRRVAIARSLAAQEPRMFLYDEPTSDLDPVSATKIRALILNLAGNDRGFIVVTHEIPDALKLANRFMFLKNGTILFDGTKEELLTTNVPELKFFLGDWSKDTFYCMKCNVKQRGQH